MQNCFVILLFFTCLIACDTSKTITKDILSDHKIKSSKGVNTFVWGNLDQDSLLDTMGINSIFGRKVTFRDISLIKSGIRHSGTIVIKICIDRGGLVSYAEVLKDQSTIEDEKTIQTFLESAIGTKYAPDPEAPIQECGRMKFVVNEKKNLSNSEVDNGQEINEQTLTWGHRDTMMSGFDGSGDGVYGRKIIYRDLSTVKKGISESGTISMEVCINRDGIVNYTKLLWDETTVKSKDNLKVYLKAARGYKFQSNYNAPIQQCGKIKFKIDNSLSNKLR